MAFRKTTSLTLVAAALVAAATLTTTPPAAADPMPTGGEGLPVTPADLAVATKSCTTATTACKAEAAADGSSWATRVTCNYCYHVCAKAATIVEVLGRPAEAPQWTDAASACTALEPGWPEDFYTGRGTWRRA